MSDEKKVSHLVTYFDNTLELINNGYITSDQGKAILASLEPEITNKKEIYSYLPYYNTHKLDYWYKFLVSKDEEALDYLRTVMQKNYANQNILEKVIERFLKMPKNIRKELYETNFTKIELSPKRQIDYVEMCGQNFALAEPSKVFHNLPSLYLLTAKSQINIKIGIVEEIINDMKSVLKLSDSKFLDTYGHALIHTLDTTYIYKNWHNLEINKRKDFQEAFVNKLIYRGSPRYDDFINLVENGHLPYDVKYPRSNQYLMSMFINDKLNNVTNYFRTTPFSEDELKLRMKQTKEYMVEINQKYNLYFFEHSVLENNSKIMTTNFVHHYSRQDKSLFAKMEGEVLKYQFEIDDIFKKKELKQTKKLKI